MKKKARQLFSMAVAIAITFSCLTAAAFAADNRTHAYELYQIFTGNFSGDVLSDVEWGKNAKKPAEGEPADGGVSETVLQELAATSTASDTEKLAVITKYVDFSSAPYKGEMEQPVKSPEGKYTYSGITPGYYIIKDKDTSQDGEGGAYTLYVVQAVGAVLEFEPKTSIPTVTKQINDNGVTSTNSASIGEEVEFVVTGTLPSRIADYATYFYKFSDTLSKGLTYKSGSLRVSLKNADAQEDITEYFYVHAGDYNNATGTPITVAIQDLKALTQVMQDGVAKYSVNAETQVVVSYTATLNENALIKAPNTNEVNLIYSNDPNNSGTPSQTPPPSNPPVEPNPDPNNPVGETVKAITETYTTALSVKKTNEEGETLQGAVFTLSGNGVKQVLVTELVFEVSESGTYYKLNDGTYTETAPTPETTNNYADIDTKYAKATKVSLKGEGQAETSVQGEVDATGVITFTGLGAGEYLLTETKAPDGYNRMDPISFSITFDSESKQFASSNETITLSAEDGVLHTTIVNYPGTRLPSTGGMGTTLFYAAGSVMAVGAIVLLIVKKRMDAEND